MLRIFTIVETAEIIRFRNHNNSQAEIIQKSTQSHIIMKFQNIKTEEERATLITEELQLTNVTGMREFENHH